MTDSVNTARLQQLFDQQRAAVRVDPVPALELRLDRIARIRQMIENHLENFRIAMTADFGSIHPSMVEMLDTFPVVDRTGYFETHLADWMQPTAVPLGPEHGSSTAEVVRVPKGVNGNIAPWNFPIESALVMTVDILAAGNTVIVKPSELAPATAQALEDAVADHFEPEVMAVVQGGVDVASAFSAMQWDHLTYTGSGRVGRLVMEAAARNLVPVTLELGGKNPALFAADGVTAELVGRMIAFKALKAGQICTSPDYALVPRERVEEWIDLASSYWQDAYPTYVGHRDATGIINDAHYRRVVGYIDEAREQGVRTVVLNDDVPDPELRHISLTLVVDPPADLACMTEETFGPVLPVVSYDSVDEAIDLINSGPSPLGSYLATYDDALADRFVSHVRSGGTGINTFGLQGGNAALPFGGFGASGHGCHSGYGGFINYSHTKSVFRGADDSFVHQVIMPPYDKAGQN
ncbi:MAG: aldehyde dehydrogenase family protein [Acidimicrobiales bacterium]